MREIIRDTIRDLVRSDPGNRDEGGARFFDAPLVGFASATDALFHRYKSIIGPFHWTPAEVLDLVYGHGGDFRGTVVCWVLPVGRDVRLSNRRRVLYPSRPWGRTRNFGEQFNDALRREVVALLRSRGYRAVAPMLLEQWHEMPDHRNRISSKWSERHAAYAAGLGTFSINDGMITEKGIAHRLGTVVTDLVVPPDPRLFTDHRENCLLFRDEACGVCMDRCPVNAISLDGHDKKRCRDHCNASVLRKAKEYGVSITGCGLCQTGVPCETSVPRPKPRRDTDAAT